jgi:hypothetical protein
MSDIAPERPHFVIDEDVSTKHPDAVADIRQFESAIWRSPDSYAVALCHLSSLAITSQAGPNIVRLPLPSKYNEPLNSTQVFLAGRYDLLFEFDPSTEGSLEQNETLKSLKRSLDLHRSRNLKDGRNIRHVEDPEAINIRDTMRRYRLYSFIGRVADWQQREAARTSTPETSTYNAQ